MGPRGVTSSCVTCDEIHQLAALEAYGLTLRVSLQMWFWQKENAALFWKCRSDETEKQVLINAASVLAKLHMTSCLSQWAAWAEPPPGPDAV